MVEVRRREKESVGSLLRRFHRNVQYARIIIKAREGRFFESPPTKRARRLQALRRIERTKEIERLKKLGKWKEEVERRGR